MTTAVFEIVERIKELPDIVFDESKGNPELPMPVVWRTTVQAAVPWNQREFEYTLDLKLPSDIVEFWHYSSGARLFEDINYGQWGVIIWSSQEAGRSHPELTDYRNEDFQLGDLIIGECLGDSDLILVRCNQEELDFGEVMISYGIRPRSEWTTAAKSFPEFLKNLIDAEGQKFWDLLY